jgi:hypothetical protein
MKNEPALYSIFIKINALPKSVNQTGRLHWAVKTKIVNEWKALVCLAIGSRKPPKPLEFASIVYTRHSSRQLDYDNLVNSYKAVQDGLVTAGILLDDKVKNIGHPVYHWEKAPQKDGFITIQVTEIKIHLFSRLP